MDTPTKLSCADCASLRCNGKAPVYPDFCVSQQIDQATKEDLKALYAQEDNAKVMAVSAEVEADFYCQMTRLQELIVFARRMGFQKLGIATCAGLSKESRILAKILREQGFEVFGAVCKVGEIPKADVGLSSKCSAIGQNMCNPILQAQLLEKEGTQLNIVMGLCVGHDSLFYKYSTALTTTLVTKDRVLGHNPVAALYGADGYYAKKLKATLEIT